jgi:hypothetical protein
MLRGGWLGHSLALGAVALILATGYYEFVLPARSGPDSSPPSGRTMPSPRASEPSVLVRAVASGSLPDATAVRPRISAGAIDALQITLLGGSASVREVDALVSLDTSSAASFTLTVTYWGTRDGARTAVSQCSTTLVGARTYQVPLGIPTDAYCGGVVTVAAVAGELTASENTSPGC